MIICDMENINNILETSPSPYTNHYEVLKIDLYTLHIDMYYIYTNLKSI